MSNISYLPVSATPARTTENGKVPPKRHKDTRPRKHLEPSEVAALLKAAHKSGRYRLRDEVAVMLAYRHGLRATELVSLQWAQIDLRGATIVIPRAKGGFETHHPLRSIELRLLGKLRRENPEAPYVLMTERCSAWPPPPSYPSRSTPTHYGTHAATNSQPMATTLGPCRITSDIAVYNRPRDTQRSPRRASRISSATDAA